MNSGINDLKKESASELWVTTKGGDRGETSLANGKRVAKDHPRVETYGTLDECQAHVGLARSLCGYPEICEQLCLIEQELGKAMGHLALYPGLLCPEIGILEKITELAGERAGKNFRFIRPGDSTPGAALHIARTVARRAERSAVKLFREGEMEADIYSYINRLSDALYALSLWYDFLSRGENGETSPGCK